LPVPPLRRDHHNRPGQIVIPVDAREAMQIKEGDKVVILRGPPEGSIIVFRVDSFDVLLQLGRDRQRRTRRGGGETQASTLRPNTSGPSTCWDLFGQREYMC
jgi:AbrB family looped-hinge helix DNA binding protein